MTNIILPKNWKQLTESEQIEWIEQQQPKQVNLITLEKTLNVEHGTLTTKEGTEIVFPQKVEVTKYSNLAIVDKRYNFENGVIIIFHFEGSFDYLLSFSNNYTKKKTAFRILPDEISKIDSMNCFLKHKFGLFSKKSSKN